MTLCGILNVNKPAGVTSRVAVDRVERLLRPARVGHAGTLDPLATGVLVVCVGQATRLIQYVQQMPKTYRATFQLGRRSDTDDIAGEVCEVPGAVPPVCEELNRAIARFIGDIPQRPPAHSAVKFAGRRAYQLARRGISVELKPRTVSIHQIKVRRYAYPELELDVECGSGTYIRALGRDLGEALGTGAVMSALERTAIGRFRTDEALSIDEISAATIARRLQPALVVLGHLPQVTLSAAQLIEVRHGRPILTAWLRDAGDAVTGVKEIAAVDATGQLAAILFEKQAGELWPRFIFN